MILYCTFTCSQKYQHIKSPVEQQVDQCHENHWFHNKEILHNHNPPLMYFTTRCDVDVSIYNPCALHHLAGDLAVMHVGTPTCHHRVISNGSATLDLVVKTQWLCVRTASPHGKPCPRGFKDPYRNVLRSSTRLRAFRWEHVWLKFVFLLPVGWTDVPWCSVQFTGWEGRVISKSTTGLALLNHANNHSNTQLKGELSCFSTKPHWLKIISYWVVYQQCSPSLSVGPRSLHYFCPPDDANLTSTQTTALGSD